MADNTRSPEEIARLNARMAEIDRYLKDPKMKLGRGPTGKFQFYKADQRKQATSVSPKKTSTATSTATTTKTSTPSRFTSLSGSGPRTGGASINPPVHARPIDNEASVNAARESNKLAAKEFKSAKQRMNDILGESASQKRDLALGAATALPIGRGAKYLYDLSRLTRPGKALIKSLENLPEESANILDKFRQSGPQYKKGGSVRPGKVRTVMHEFKTGKLKSSSGQKVTNRKQAVAIAMSEAGMKKAKKFGDGGQAKSLTTKELEEIGKTEVANQTELEKARKEAQQQKAPVSKRYAKGGEVGESKAMMKKEVAFMKRKGAPKSMVKHEEAEAKGMKRGGTACYAKGGSVRADGCATKGKTRCKTV